MLCDNILHSGISQRETHRTESRPNAERVDLDARYGTAHRTISAQFISFRVNRSGGTVRDLRPHPEDTDVFVDEVFYFVN